LTGDGASRVLGITFFGGYLPTLRLSRESAFESMGWYAPELAAYRKGERAFCNADEDALTMAVEASRSCLEGLPGDGPGGIILASTTLPFSDRLNAGILKTALQLGDDLFAADVTGSRRAGTTALVTALSQLRGAPSGQLLVVASDRRLARSGCPEELSTGDGAGALLLGTEGVVAELLGVRTLTRDIVDHYRSAKSAFDYRWEERWIRTAVYDVIPEIVHGLLSDLSLSLDDIATLVYPCPSPAAHRRIGERIGVFGKVADNLHASVGETGAAHPLVMLIHALETARPGDVIVAVGVGSGADALCFRVTEEISRRPRRRGIRDALGRGRVERNYSKFLKFRDLLTAETGIRREAPQKTALSVLSRHRDMLTGLVGGRCERCGTPQFPKTRVCVNPACRAEDTQAPYGFANRTAVIRTFTADRLGASPNPPNLYGMVQFEGGGRMLAEFTDCELPDLEVGGRVRMCFRKRYDDATRGFSGYFWKAVPVGKGEG
jgi:3-hydroxy-3-methylglutaryl CoA synthase